MQADVLNRLSLFITASWVLLMMYRLFVFNEQTMDPGTASVVRTIVDVLLVAIILVLLFVLLKKVGIYTVAKAKKSTHCQQCYAKMGTDEEFCPKCGWSRDPAFNKDR